MTETTQQKPSMKLLYQVARGSDLHVSQDLPTQSFTTETVQHEEAFDWENHIPANQPEQPLSHESTSIADEHPEQPLNSSYDDLATVSSVSDTEILLNTTVPVNPDPTRDNLDSENVILSETIIQPNDDDASEQTAARAEDSFAIDDASDVFNTAPSEITESQYPDKELTNWTRFNANDFKTTEKQKPGQALESVFIDSDNHEQPEKTVDPPGMNSVHPMERAATANPDKTGFIRIQKTDAFSAGQHRITINKTMLTQNPAKPESSRPLHLQTISTHPDKDVKPAATEPVPVPEKQVLTAFPGHLKINKPSDVAHAIKKTEKLPLSEVKEAKESTSDKHTGKVKINNINISVRQRERQETTFSSAPQYADHIITESWEWSCRYGK